MSAKKAAKKTAAKKTAAKKTAVKKTASGTPDHRDIVQLATQLVSAQIMANAQYDASVQMMREVRQFGLDIVDALNDTVREVAADGGETASEESRMLRMSAAIMTASRRERRLKRRSKLLEPLSHPDLDRLFQSAMRRAFVMLNAPFDTERIVFAEQIFSATEKLAEGAIRRRFIDFTWPRLSSGDSVNKLMQDVNRWFTRHLIDLSASRQSVDGKESISALDPSIPLATRIEAETDKLSWLLLKASQSKALPPDTVDSYRTLESALRDVIRTRNGSDFGGAFRSLDAIERSNLIFAMFGGNGPREGDSTDAEAEQDTSPEETDDDETTSRKYHAWAIFRYLRRHGRESGDELGRNLNKRLRAIRSILNKKYIPDIAGIAPREYEFSPLHEEVERLLEDYESEEAYSDAAANSDALELHGLDPEDVALGASEFDDPQSDESIPHF